MSLVGSRMQLTHYAVFNMSNERISVGKMLKIAHFVGFRSHRRLNITAMEGHPWSPRTKKNLHTRKRMQVFGSTSKDPWVNLDPMRN